MWKRSTEPLLILSPKTLTYEWSKVNKNGKIVYKAGHILWKEIYSITIEYEQDDPYDTDETAVCYLIIDHTRIPLHEISLSPRQLMAIFERHKPIIVPKNGICMRLKLSYFYEIWHRGQPFVYLVILLESLYIIACRC